MAVDNTTVGSVLTIPDGLLKNLEKVDEKLENIQKKARETEKEFNASFQGMDKELASFLPNLQKIVTALNSAAKHSKTMGENMGGAVDGVNKLNGSITAAIEVINKMRTLVQTPTSGGSFMSHVSTLVDAISVRVSGMGVKFKDFKRQLLELDTAAMQKAMKAQSDAKINLMNEQIATTNAKVNLEQAKQNRLYAQAATEAAKLARAQAQLAQAQAMAATAQERATAANERAARRATIRQYGADATSAMSYVNNAANTGTFNQRAIAIKVLEEAIKNLNKTDRDYQKNLQELSNKYRELKAEQDKVVGSYREMQQHHRSLMDTTGQLQRAFALMFSVSQIRGYINQIAQVRGEFELQQRSLEAILQNKTKADEIFNKTVALAVQSPFQIKDLVSYTKQLAAYRIESDKLYDTTKRLADVSAGLGVDMQRLILAYGQVKAAAYLRGTEVRQFTEAGINLYGELQAYFKEVKGEAYTTAQIVDMISKRMVTFEDVEAIFRRITDQGGIFYNMQAIQAETLQGKIANLKDSIDVMLNDIGKANEGALKGTIDTVNVLIRNWEKIANVGKALVGVFVLLKIHSLQTGVAMSSVFTKTMMANAASTLKFTELLHYGFLNLGKSVKIFGANMKSAFMTNLPLIAITALVSAIYEAYIRINSFREAVTKSNEELVKARGDLADLANEYKNLRTAMNDAGKVQERKKDPAKDIEARRNALQKLIDLAGKNGLTLNIKVAQVKEEELDAVFNVVKNKYNRFLTEIAILQRRTEKNKIGNAWYTLSDNIDEDATDYRNAVIDILAQSDKLDVAIANVKANYDSLSVASKRYFTEISMGKKERETEIEYYTRMYNAMLQINKLNVGTLGGLPQWLKETNDVLKDISGGFDDIETQAKEFSRELDDVLGDVIAHMRKRGEEGVVIQAVIDRYAAQQGYDDIQKMFMYNHFNVKVEFDKDDINKSIGSIKQQLDNAFANNVYTISFELAGVDSKSGYKLLNDEMKLKLDELQRLVEMRKNLKGGNYVGYDPVALNTEINALYKDISNMGKGYKELADQIMGYNKNTTNSTNTNKIQRDILSEQISLLKEMQSRYDSLRDVMSDDKAQSSVLSYYQDSLKYVKMPSGIVNTFVPTKQGVIDALNKLIPTIKDFKKRMEAKNFVAELKVEIQKEELQKEIDAAKQQIDDAFNGLNVYTDLKKLGLGESDIAKMFGDLPKTFDDVQKKIAEVYNGKEGEDWAKQRQETEKKLQEQVVKYNLDTFKELTKAYGQQLDEQLQLDQWYVEEKKKINEVVTDPEIKAEYERNLKKKYEQKSDEISWKEFQNSEFYIKIFENLDTTSSRVLEAMSERLQDLRGSLKNLSPEQLKQVVSAMEQVNEKLIDKNPLKGLSSSIKESIKYAKQRKEIESKYIDDLKKQKQLEEDNEEQSKIVQQKKEEFEAAVAAKGAMSMQAIIAHNAYVVEKEKLDVILKELEAQGNITEEQAKQIREGERQISDTQKRFATMKGYVDELNGAWHEMSDMLSNFGVDVSEEISGIMEGFSQTLGGLESINLAKPFTIITGTIKTFAGLGNTVANIFGFGNKDNKLQKQIEEQQKAVERLQRAYEKLEESISNAFTASDLNANTQEAINNLRQQNEDIERMIALENDKKKTDKDQIQEWYNQIEDNREQIEELLRQQTEEMGGFGDKANYKSAAQEFADAWMDAYNSSSDTLEALQGKMDDYFDNLLKKQLMQRAAGKYFDAVFKAFDDAVAEGSAGGANGLEVTREELDKIKEIAATQSGLFDEYAKGLMEILGASPQSSTTLSQLQQGIQSLSESTGQALESLLNSIRFFVAQQSTDVAAIRQLLSATSNIEVGNSDNSPMLRELQTQTAYLRDIKNAVQSVIKNGGHPKNGAGIKVFQD